MPTTITEKKYPIRNIWLGKDIIMYIFSVPFVFFVFLIQPDKEIRSMLPLIIIFYLFAFILSFGVSIVIKALQRANFHYALEDKFIVLHQGIITKQNRNIPYGRIQSVMLHQKVYERILGIASLTFEDFSNGGKSQMSIDGYVSRGKSRREILGFLGNRIRIPGLRKNDAEALKVHILQKIKENPMEDSQSGL